MAALPRLTARVFNRRQIAKVIADTAPKAAAGEKRKRNEDGVVPHVLGSS
jgi:hypothetical protein